MNTLAIDIETYSPVNLKNCGLYKYVESPEFEILLFSYSYNGDRVHTYDFTEEFGNPDADAPFLWQELVELLTDPTIKKTAHNANFERVCLQKYFGVQLPIEQWECTMVKCAMLGYPLALDAVARVMNLEVQKMEEGKSLIRYFSVPCKPTKTNGQRTRNLPIHDPEKWEQYKEYNRNDVVVERAISDKINAFIIPDTERRLYALDQKINDLGLLVDELLVRNAIKINREYVADLTREAINITGLENPNSRQQLIEWLNEEFAFPIETLRKTDIPEYIKLTDDEDVLRILTIRQEMSKTSVKKYDKIIDALCPDGRVRGLLQFCGAGRTWRWAGRLIQVQNLPKNQLQGAELELARQIVHEGDGDLLKLIFGNVPDILSQLIRTSFKAAQGKRYVVSDFSAIEARVIAWLAGEEWRMDVFRKKGKIYEESASRMFRIPIEQITKGSVYRQKGKMAELALGYQGGPNAIINIEVSNKTPIEKRIPVDELPELVRSWRQASPKIVNLWYKVERAALSAMKGYPTTIQHGIRFYRDYDNDLLCITLPSGRNLSYSQPQLRVGKFDKDQVTYMGLGEQQGTSRKWQRISTYGGKLVENIVQAIARDLLGDAMIRIEDAGYDLVMDVHDEIVAEEDVINEIALEEINDIMRTPAAWAIGLPMEADSYETTFYYKKD